MTRFRASCLCGFGAVVSAMVLWIGSAPASAKASAAAVHVETEGYGSAPVITVSRAGDGLGAPIELRSAKTVAGEADAMGRHATMPSILPLDSALLTSAFGMRSDPVLGRYRMHSGVDLAARAGTPVRASKDGVVAFANWRGGYGLFVSLRHLGGMETRYGHMSRLLVSPGEHVVRGQVLGLVGSTGLSTGPHLHYEVLLNGRAIDPLRRR